MLKNSLYSVDEAPPTEFYVLVPNQGRVYMNFLGGISKLLSFFDCPGILKRRFQCLKVAVNRQKYLEVSKESTTLLLEQDVRAIWHPFAP